MSSAARRYGEVWSVLEKNYGWVISEQQIDNPKVQNSLLPHGFQDYDNRRAVQFRQMYKLDELIADAADDWEAVLRLRHWAYNNIRNGTPAFASADPLALIAASQAGGTFWCTFYAYAFMAAASSVGIPARHMGVDCEHTAQEASSHHGVNDVWVNKFRKWVAVDPHFDSHYELDGVPLNSEEVAQAWLRNKGAGVKAVIGPQRREYPAARTAKVGSHESCGYFWYYIDCNNQVFQKQGQSHPDPAFILMIPERKAQTWYQGAANKTYKHVRYANGSFVQTERYADVFPELNCVELEPGQRPALPYCSPVRIWSGVTPNFSHYEVSVDGAPGFRFDGIEFPWRLHPGQCSLSVRAVNLGGLRGPEARLALQIEPDNNRRAEWPPRS